MSKIDLNKFKDVVGQLKTKQKQIQTLMNKETLKEAKKYAETSGQELKRLIKTTDVQKVKSFIEKEAKEIQKIQKNLPQEFAKFSKFMETQKKEFEKLLKSVHALDAVTSKVAAKVAAKVGPAGLGKKSKASLVIPGSKKKQKTETKSPETTQETPSK